MYNSLPDILRRISVNSLFSTKTVQKCWPIWQYEIKNILKEDYSESQIIDLGDHLSEIFKSTGGKGRGQDQLSGGGVGWESLVCWYLNLCCAGSRIVAFRKMSLVPEPIRNAITVNYGNFSCNTEADITVIIFPDVKEFRQNITDIKLEMNGKVLKPFKKVHLNQQFLNQITANYFEKFEIGIIQCKTNWNDNAQIPMLWDMIYSANGFRDRSITIGRETYSIQHCSNFTYSFVTVPSNKEDQFQAHKLAVKRIRGTFGERPQNPK